MNEFVIASNLEGDIKKAERIFSFASKQRAVPILIGNITGHILNAEENQAYIAALSHIRGTSLRERVFSADELSKQDNEVRRNAGIAYSKLFGSHVSNTSGSLSEKVLSVISRIGNMATLCDITPIMLADSLPVINAYSARDKVSQDLKDQIIAARSSVWPDNITLLDGETIEVGGRIIGGIGLSDAAKIQPASFLPEEFKSDNGTAPDMSKYFSDLDLIIVNSLPEGTDLLSAVRRKIVIAANSHERVMPDSHYAIAVIKDSNKCYAHYRVDTEKNELVRTVHFYDNSPSKTTRISLAALDHDRPISIETSEAPEPQFTVEDNDFKDINELLDGLMSGTSEPSGFSAPQEAAETEPPMDDLLAHLDIPVEPTQASEDNTVDNLLAELTGAAPADQAVDAVITDLKRPTPELDFQTDPDTDETVRTYRPEFKDEDTKPTECIPRPDEDLHFDDDDVITYHAKGKGTELPPFNQTTIEEADHEVVSVAEDGIVVESDDGYKLVSEPEEGADDLEESDTERIDIKDVIEEEEKPDEKQPKMIIASDIAGDLTKMQKVYEICYNREDSSLLECPVLIGDVTGDIFSIPELLAYENALKFVKSKKGMKDRARLAAALKTSRSQKKRDAGEAYAKLICEFEEKAGYKEGSLARKVAKIFRELDNISKEKGFTLFQLADSLTASVLGTKPGRDFVHDCIDGRRWNYFLPGLNVGGIGLSSEGIIPSSVLPDEFLLPDKEIPDIMGYLSSLDVILLNSLPKKLGRKLEGKIIILPSDKPRAFSKGGNVILHEAPDTVSVYTKPGDIITRHVYDYDDKLVAVNWVDPRTLRLETSYTAHPLGCADEEIRKRRRNSILSTVGQSVGYLSALALIGIIGIRAYIAQRSTQTPPKAPAANYASPDPIVDDSELEWDGGSPKVDVTFKKKDPVVTPPVETKPPVVVPPVETKPPVVTPPVETNPPVEPPIEYTNLEFEASVTYENDAARALANGYMDADLARKQIYKNFRATSFIKGFLENSPAYKEIAKELDEKARDTPINRLLRYINLAGDDKVIGLDDVVKKVKAHNEDSDRLRRMYEQDYPELKVRVSYTDQDPDHVKLSIKLEKDQAVRLQGLINEYKPSPHRLLSILELNSHEGVMSEIDVDLAAQDLKKYSQK